MPVYLRQTMTWLYTQIKYLPRDIKSHIICGTKENLDKFPIADVHSLSTESRLDYIGLRLVRKYGIRFRNQYLSNFITNEKVDLVHSHFGPTGWGDAKSIRGSNVRHVVTFYGADISLFPATRPKWRRRYKQLFDEVDTVLCEGPFMAETAIQMGCTEEKVEIHHLGVELDRLPYVPRVRKEGEPFKVLIAATFREKKGIPYALEALGRLQQNYPLEITVIGDATREARSQAEKKKILDIVRKWGIEPNIRMLGFQPHAKLIKESYRNHIFLSPSVTASDGDTEGGAPVSIIEMAASGLLIVSTNHCDIPEVIIDRKTGLLADERDTDGIVNSLQWLFENEEKWDEYSRRGRQRIETEFDARQQGVRLAAIYKHTS